MVLVEEINDDVDYAEGFDPDSDARPWETVGMEVSGKVTKLEPATDGGTIPIKTKYDLDEEDRVAKQFALGESLKTKGNEMLSQGDYPNAVRMYNKAIEELNSVGNSEEARARHEKDTQAIHLNMALAHLKAGSLKEAKDLASRVLILEPNNLKGLYRRGMAQARAAREAPQFQDAEALEACADFEALLELEPTNNDARKELSRVRKELQENKREWAAKQKATWGGLLGGRTETNDEPTPESVLPPVRQFSDAVKRSQHLNVTLDAATLPSSRGEDILKDFSLELRQKWCVGLAVDNASTRAALVKLVTQELSTRTGTVTVHQIDSAQRRPDAFTIDKSIVVAVGVAFTALAIGLAFSPQPIWVALLVAVIGIGVEAALYMMWVEDIKKYPVICRLTSDTDATKAFGNGQAVKDIIGSRLPKSISKEDRIARVIALVRAAGLAEGTAAGTFEDQICNGLKFGALSASQKWLVHFIWTLAAKPAVLVCDEVLVGVDEALHARVLRMIMRMKQDCKTSVLYLSADLGQLRVMSDFLGIIVSGELRECGPTYEVLEHPRSEDMKQLVTKVSKDTWKSVTGKPPPPPLQVVGKDLQDRYNALVREKALCGEWLPNVRGFIPNVDA